MPAIIHPGAVIHYWDHLVITLRDGPDGGGAETGFLSLYAITYSPSLGAGHVAIVEAARIVARHVHRRPRARRAPAGAPRRRWAMAGRRSDGRRSSPGSSASPYGPDGFGYRLSSAEHEIEARWEATDPPFWVDGQGGAFHDAEDIWAIMVGAAARQPRHRWRGRPRRPVRRRRVGAEARALAAARPTAPSPRCGSNRSDPIVPLEAIRPDLDDDLRPGREERLPVSLDRLVRHVLAAEVEGRFADGLALDRASRRRSPGRNRRSATSSTHSTIRGSRRRFRTLTVDAAVLIRNDRTRPQEPVRRQLWQAIRADGRDGHVRDGRQEFRLAFGGRDGHAVRIRSQAR